MDCNAESRTAFGIVVAEPVLFATLLQMAIPAVLEIVSAPGTISVSLGAATSPELHADWHEQQGMALTGQNMPVLGADRAYQLWVIPKTGSPQPTTQPIWVGPLG